jgi:hypothetical protein
MEAKYQLYEPQENTKYGLYIFESDLDLLCKKFTRLVLRVGSSFLFGQTMKTIPKPHLQRVLPCKHPYHIGDLGVVYIMDHEVVPRPCKICDWLLNSSEDHFILHQGKNVKAVMELEVPKRHMLRPTLSTDMVQWVFWWERQKRYSGKNKHGPTAKKCCYKI